MRYGLLSIFYATTVIGASLAAFGPWGIVLGGLVLYAWSIAFAGKARSQVVLAGLVLFLLLVLAGLLMPAINSTYEASRRIQCMHNQRQIVIALHMYHETYDCFPPAYVADEQGRPMHSWRVLILPFIEETRLYRQYDFSEPWDGPNNRLLAARTPSVYRCPERRPSEPPGETSYVVVVGPDTAWPGATPRKIQDIRDGTFRTLLLVEAPDARIHWMEPRDLTVDEFLDRHALDGRSPACFPHRQDAFLSYAYCYNAGFADNHQVRVCEPASRDVLRAALTINGGEKSNDPSDFGEPRRYWRWSKIVAVCCFLLLAALPGFWLRGHLERCERRALSVESSCDSA